MPYLSDLRAIGQGVTGPNMSQSNGHDVEAIFGDLEHRTTKWSSYLPVYQELLARYVNKPITIVEIGILNGGSLFMWRELLGPDARIIGIDNNPGAKALEAEGFEIFIGNQACTLFWAEFFAAVGAVDVIIDDGGHTNKQQIETLEACLDNINDGGMLITEDTHTSYMSHFGNPSKFNFMNFSKHVVDLIQHRSPLVENRTRNRFRSAVFAVNFYESIVCFRIDRAACADSREIVSGHKEIGAVDTRHAEHWDLPVEKITSALASIFGKRAGWVDHVVRRVRGKVLQFQMALENMTLRRHFQNHK